MCIDEWEARLDSALQALESSVQQQQQRWHEHVQQLNAQLMLAREQEAELREQIETLVARMNSVSASPERNPLLQKVNVIRTHIDALAKDAEAFCQSLP
ncbi:hypothetical protein [Lonsdalea britannica]|uniref:hypothetical protein n=1 Tax=Lonsdalea britannica TaxID=1082704 RepID=UPI0026EE2D9B|nr:hypothetical protein [Lonsdalea britannica]